MPERIQRKRTKGWRMPENAVYVGRPSKWGNPFRVITSPCCPTWDVVDDNGVTYVIDHKWAHTNNWTDLHRTGALRWARLEAVRLYHAELTEWMTNPELSEMLPELRGHDLVCWCPIVDEHGNRMPCHADVLLELANEEA